MRSHMRRVRPHRAKLDQSEWLLVPPHACLAEQRRPCVEQARDRQSQKQRTDEDKTNGAEENVQYA